MLDSVERGLYLYHSLEHVLILPVLGSTFASVGQSDIHNDVTLQRPDHFKFILENVFNPTSLFDTSAGSRGYVYISLVLYVV